MHKVSHMRLSQLQACPQRLSPSAEGEAAFKATYEGDDSRKMCVRNMAPAWCASLASPEHVPMTPPSPFFILSPSFLRSVFVLSLKGLCSGASASKTTPLSSDLFR